MYRATGFSAGDGTFHVIAYDGGDDAEASVARFREAAQSLTVK